MIKKVPMLAIALSISTYAPSNAATDDQSELTDITQSSSSSKKRKLEEKAKPEVAKEGNIEIPEISIDMSSEYRKNKVTKLKLSFNDNLTDINFLLGFPTLTSLNLICCPNLKDNYHPISKLTNLRTLNLSYIGLTTTRYLKPLINLTSLKIDLPKKGLKYIVKLPSLKNLTLCGNTDGIDKLRKLGQLTSLEKLSLNGMFNNVSDNPDYECPSLEFLSQLTNLTTLNLANNHYIFRIKPIVKLPNLTDLDLSACISIRDLRKLSKLESLIKLNLDFLNKTHMPTIEKDLKHLKELKNLRRLTICECINIPKFSKMVKINRV